ncbi:MAG: hypothetical protein Q8Q08_02560 [Candidatus Omnitrophota bacterium]|nr:hypothetical protein [Candidatus Omnitrophota bacterium]MDZ4243430.1 hypothetical protein [Candidatus Omnitrophota bacterium]
MRRGVLKSRWLLIFAVGMAAAWIIKDVLMKAVITTAGSGALGAPVSMEGFSSNPLTQKVHIRGLRVGNPAGFPKETLLDIPDVVVDFDLPSVLKGENHLPLVRMNMKELIVVKNKDGQLNVDALKVVQDAKKKEEKKDQTVPSPKGAAQEMDPWKMKMQIDVLKLNVEKVVFKDYSKGDPPFVKAYDVPLKNKTFRNIKGLPQMITLVLVQAMGPTAIKSAGLYGAAAWLGVGFLPAGVLGVIVAKDNATAEYEGISLKTVFDVCLKAISDAGSIKRSDPASGFIQGKFQGCDVKVRIQKAESRRVHLQITARKFLLAKPEIASGLLYQINQQLQ